MVNLIVLTKLKKQMSIIVGIQEFKIGFNSPKNYGEKVDK